MSSSPADVVHQAVGTIQSATAVAGQVLNGMSPSDFAASLLAASLERADVLLAMVFLGGALGAGCWIGWELSKFLFGVIRSVGRSALGKPAPSPGRTIG